MPILFISISEDESPWSSDSLTESERHLLEQDTGQEWKSNDADSDTRLLALKNQLIRLGNFQFIYVGQRALKGQFDNHSHSECKLIYSRD